jgi:hypothetical protein
VPNANCGWVYIDAQLVLSGAGWLNVQGNANAWANLGGALVSDLASLLGRAQADVSISSIAAGANALTVVFTARSNALAEAARIAALIRDDIPASAPLPATINDYASVGQASSDVSVASHTGTSRDAFDQVCSGSSNANEVTTAAPYGSQPAEVTTAAPYASQPAEVTTAAPYASQPAEVTTAAPYASQPAEVTTAAPYASQPAEVTTMAPGGYKPSGYVPSGWANGDYSPAGAQASLMPWLAAAAAVVAAAVMVR